MNDPYLDPQRGRSEKPGVFSRIVRLVGMAMLLTGIAMGCYTGLRWLQTGGGDTALVNDALRTQLPQGAQAWIARPQSWYGLHRLVMWTLRIPMFASVAFCGFLILLASTATNRK